MTSWIVFVDDAGNYAFDEARAFRAYLQKFKGQELIFTIKRRSYRQGSQSMRYYRGVVIPDVALASGYVDPDDYESVHEGMAWKFLRLPDGNFGEPRRRSTGKDDLSQEEMSHYIDQVITYAETSIPGCWIRRPEDVDFSKIVDPGWH